MSKITVRLLIFISILLSACGSKDSVPPINIIPAPCEVMAGKQISLSVPGTFSKDAVIEWETTSGVISPNTGFAVIFTAPSEAGKATITAVVITGESKTPKSIECQISPLPVTEIPPQTQTPIPTATETLVPTLAFTPTPACDQLGIEDFKLISPIGLHGDPIVGSNIPKLAAHAPITWEPSHCPLTIEVYMGGVLVRKYISSASGSIDPNFIMNDIHFDGKIYRLKSGDWIEIKIWVEGKSPPSDNVHLLLP